MIQQSDLTNVELSKKYNVNVKTVAKYKERDFTEDKSSRPNTMHCHLWIKRLYA